MFRLLVGFTLFAVPVGIPVQAATMQSHMLVQVTVQGRAVLSTAAGADGLELTSEDVARGYAEVTGRYRVESTAKRGWLLRLAPRTGLAREVEVVGLARPLVVRDDVVEVFRPTAGATEILELRYRVLLEPGAAPGRYAAPLHLSASPL